MTHKASAIVAFSMLTLLIAFLPAVFVAQEPTKREHEQWLREAAAFEVRQTDKLSGVPVQQFPGANFGDRPVRLKRVMRSD